MRGGGLALVAALAAGVDAAAAQALRVPGGAAELGASYDGTHTATGGGPESTGHDVREWLALPFAGSLMGPDVVAYQVTLRPTWQQRRQTGYESTLRTRQVNLAGSVRLLQRLPINLAATAVRQSGTGAGGFGSLTDFDASTLGADLFWRNPVFPMQLSYQRQSADQLWRNAFAGDTQRLGQTTKALRFAASSSKLSVDLQRVVNDDRVGDVDFTALGGNVAHTLRWGRGSTLETILEYGDQRGGFEFLRRSWSERLRLRHGRRTTSEHTYRQAEIRAPAGASRSATWSSGIDAAPVSPLSVGLRYAYHTTRAGAARDVAQTLTPRVGVRAALATRVIASASGSFGWERRRGGDGPVLVPVVDEPHAVDVTRRFTLSATDVDVTSVVVRSSDGTAVFVEGTDYTLLPIGATLQVEVPPGSRIATGSTVLVSYRYAIPDARGEDATIGDYEVGLQARGLDLRHRRSFRNARQVAVGAPFPGVSDFDDRFTGITLRGPTRWGSASLDGALRQRDRAGRLATEWDASAALSPRPIAGAQLSVTAFWSMSRSAGVEAASVGASASVAGAPIAAVFLRAQLDALRWTQTATPPQRFVSGSVNVDWRFDGMEIGARLELHRRWLLERNTVNRAMLRVVRRF